MAPMPSTEADRALLETHGDALLDLAFRAIETRVKTGAQPTIDPDAHPEALRAPRATFVTLKLRENLRGCLGTVEAWRPLVADAADNAHRAAFDDPRFACLTENELALLDVSISLLTPLEPVEGKNEEAILAAIRPGIDGLVLKEGTTRGLFLPQVWEMLPEPWRFLAELKGKAGLPQDYWSDTLQVLRFTTTSVKRPNPKATA